MSDLSPIREPMFWVAVTAISLIGCGIGAFIMWSTH